MNLDVERLKRWCSYVAMAVLFLGGGVEYSVILPTMWDYVQSLGGEESLYGLAVAAFSIANFVTAPIYGVLFDRTKETKYIVLVANLFEISGNAMYFAAQNKYMVVVGRFLAGTGAGVGAGVSGELARITSRKYMTFVFSFFMGMRQFGLVIGPAFNLFLDQCNFRIGPFPVNRLTSPGGFMMLVWLGVELQFLLFFFTLPSSQDLNSTAAPRPPPLLKNEVFSHQVPVSRQGSINHPGGTSSSATGSDGRVYSGDSQESTPLLPHRRREAQPLIQTSQPNLLVRIFWPLAWRIWDLVQEEIVVLLFALFVILFNQSCLETMFVPMDEHLLKWSESSVSLSFTVAGVLIIVAFIVVSILSQFVADRYQIICGFVIEMFSYCWLLGCVGMATPDTPWIFERLMVGFYFAIFGLPFFTVTSASLYSKILPIRIQGFGQGVRRSVLALGSILGPLWAGGAITLSHYYVLLIVPCMLQSLVVVPLILSFPKLKE